MYLVAGLGITGRSVLRYFAEQGETCLAFDTRADLDIDSLQQEFSNVDFALGEIPNKWLAEFEFVVLSPGLAKAEPWVESLRIAGKQIIGDIELFARAVGVPVIAITGSNGKSTVTTITGEALACAGYSVGVCGNIGEPVLDLLMDDNEYDVFVLELSSFQLETTYSLQAASSVVLNISEDHMDRYTDIEDYIQAKTKVYADTEVAVMAEGFSTQGVVHHAEVVRFGLSESFVQSEADYGLVLKDGQAWLGHGNEPQISVATMKLKGRHHQLNALAMLALCRPFKVENQCFEKVLAGFSGLPHRTQIVKVHNGVSWVNDSKGTNVGATVTAIESLGAEAAHQLILIAGGAGKDADFSNLKSPVAQYCKKVILFGRDQGMIKASIQASSSGVDCEIDISCVLDLNAAMAVALETVQPGDCVLFSPACASFDQFDNYVKRGEAFVELVNQACPSAS